MHPAAVQIHRIYSTNQTFGEKTQKFTAPETSRKAFDVVGKT
jgi:hypothetical protein